MIKAMTGMLLASYSLLLAQTAPTETFEVASVKPSDPNVRGTRINSANATLTAIGITANNCVTMAYDILPFQLTGGPTWINDQRYDIVAKLGPVPGEDEAGAPHSDRMMAAMQALLAERFRLVVHPETKIMPAYVLAVAKGGFKLKETPDDGRGMMMSSGRGKMIGQRMSLESLARNLSGNLRTPVVDMTGIKGLFNFTLEWSPDDAPAKSGADGVAAEVNAPTGPSIFAAIQEQLGLKLETQKAPVKMIVIDRIEKATGN